MFGGLSRSLLYYGFVCVMSCGGLSLCGRAEERTLALWVHHFGFLYTQNEDGSPVRQKDQETTQIFPAGSQYLPGNSSNHKRRRWATRPPTVA